MTTQPRKPAIIKETQIIVESTRLDSYGNMWATDQNGDETKIAAKRSHLFPMFQPGRGVNLYWAKYMDKLYVAEAQPLGDMISAPYEPPKLIVEVPTQTATKAYEGVAPPPVREPSGQEVGLWWKEIGKMIRSHTLSEIFGVANSIEITKAYRTQALGILKLPFDGAKLPQFDKPKIEQKEG